MSREETINSFVWKPTSSSYKVKYFNIQIFSKYFLSFCLPPSSLALTWLWRGHFGIFLLFLLLLLTVPWLGVLGNKMSVKSE